MSKTTLLILSLLILAFGLFSYLTPQKEEHFIPRTERFLSTKPFERATKALNLTYLTSGSTIYSLGTNKWSYSFLSHDEMNPEQGLEIIKKLQDSIYNEMMKNPDAIQYLSKNTPFQKSDIAIKITFWTKDNDRLHPPAIAQVSYAKGVYSYNYANVKDDSLQPSVQY